MNSKKARSVVPALVPSNLLLWYFKDCEGCAERITGKVQTALTRLEDGSGMGYFEVIAKELKESGARRTILLVRPRLDPLFYPDAINFFLTWVKPALGDLVIVPSSVDVSAVLQQ
jgi:hypothetical protein